MPACTYCQTVLSSGCNWKSGVQCFKGTWWCNFGFAWSFKKPLREMKCFWLCCLLPRFHVYPNDIPIFLWWSPQLSYVQLQCGAALICLMVYKPHEYYSYLRIINHSYLSYVHQLSYRKRGPHHPNFNGIFDSKPSFWGIPIFRNPHFFPYVKL